MDQRSNTMGMSSIASPFPVRLQEDKEHGWNTGWIDAFHTITGGQ